MYLLSDYLSRTELATELGVCERTIIRWRDLGEGPPVTMIGRRPMYRKTSVAAWLASRERRTTA